jgi:hypothetical protein
MSLSAARYLDDWCIVRERDGKTSPYTYDGYGR